MVHVPITQGGAVRSASLTIVELEKIKLNVVNELNKEVRELQKRIKASPPPSPKGSNKRLSNLSQRLQRILHPNFLPGKIDIVQRKAEKAFRNTGKVPSIKQLMKVGTPGERAPGKGLAVREGKVGPTIEHRPRAGGTSGALGTIRQLNPKIFKPRKKILE